jgi:hypothetical protein
VQHEYKITMTDDQSPTGRSALFGVKTENTLKQIGVNYTAQEIDELGLLCKDEHGNSVPVIPNIVDSDIPLAFRLPVGIRHSHA